jgi:hypothetical protein
VYRVRYQASLSRALGLIRSHVQAALQAATSVAASAASDPSSTDAAFALFYGKFRAQAPRVTRAIGAVEARVSKLNGKYRVHSLCALHSMPLR